MLSPVHVVAEKEIVGFWRESSILEEPQKVVVLPVYVPLQGKKFTRRTVVESNGLTTYLDWGLEFKQDGLVDENLPRPRAEILDLVFLQLHWFTRPVAAHW